ncbi:MAG: thioredoxin-dependent thiol peroxidase [Cyclobacteriaceae bacterium]
MELKVGDKAPDFEATIQSGEKIRLSDYYGKKVVLYFYPKDNTPGCTAQSCNLRDNYDKLQKNGYIVLGVSGDTEKSHLKFIEKQSLPFDLIADTEKEVHNLYGTWGEKSMYGKKYMGTLRTTFVIDEEGNIEQVIEKVKTKNHTEQIIGEE